MKDLYITNSDNIINSLLNNDRKCCKKNYSLHCTDGAH